MKIFRKVLTYIGVGLISIGVIVIVISAAFGGRITNRFTSEKIDIDKTYENVESIDIDYRAGSILIKKGDSFNIVAKNVSKKSFASEVKDGVWTISDKKGSAFTFLTDWDWSSEDSTVTVYVPDTALLEEYSLVLGAGKIEADSLKTKEINVKVGAGEVVIKDLSAEDSTLESGVGSISIDGAITGDSIIKCGVGKIVLSLQGDPDSYDYSIKVGIGSTRINDDSYSGVTDKKINNDNATGSFTLDCGVGEINLKIEP